MYAISDLKNQLGFTEHQVRDRLALLLPALADDCKKGADGNILIGHQILTALRRMKQLEQQGLDPHNAAQQVIQESPSEDRNRNGIVSQQAFFVDQIKALEKLRIENRQLREKIAFLSRQLEEQMQVTKVTRKRGLHRLIPSFVKKN